MLLLILIPAFVAQMMTIMPSGSYYCSGSSCGVFFWGAHGHDAVWHLAIINRAFNSFPFASPIFAGEPLKGYNYLLDLILFLLTKIGISPLFSYFKLIPLVWFSLMTIVTVQCARKIQDSPLFVGLLLFFIYFGGSFSYLLTLMNHGTIWDSSGLLAMQSGLSLVNPQFAFSLVAITATLSHLMEKRINSYWIAFLIAVAFGLKFYAGVIGFFLVFMFYVISLIQQRKLLVFLKRSAILTTFAIIVLFTFYNPWESMKSGSTLKFDPMATIHPIIEEPELFYLKDTVNARYFLEAAMKETGKFSPRYLGIELMTLGLFVVLNLGTRVVGFVYFAKQLFRKKISPVEIAIGLTILFSFSLTALFIQKGIWWNTIQFTYYALFLSSIFAALALKSLFHKQSLITLTVAAVVIIFTLPTSIDIIRGFASFPAPAYAPEEELEALSFLKKQPDGVVYATAFNKKNQTIKTAPYPLIQYDDTAYITAFSGKQSFMADKTQLDLLSTPYANRLKQVQLADCDILNRVTYIYAVKGCPDPLLDSCGITNQSKRFENKRVVIYQSVGYSTIK